MKSGHYPPEFARTLLSWFCPPSLMEGIEGDLEQQFETDLAEVGPTLARRRYFFNVLRFFRPGILLRNRFTFKSFTMTLWNSYLTISSRNLMRNKGYSFINIFGLSIGIASCLLILSFIRFELSFDKTHPDLDRLYRVNQTSIWSPTGGVFSSTGPQVAFALKEDYPEVEAVTRINTPGGSVVTYDEGKGNPVSFREDNILAADSNFFSFFDFKLKEGDPQTALTGINKVVISDEVARKFFGDEPAVGKMLQFDDKGLVTITGVTTHQPKNNHFHFDYLLSIYTNAGVKRFEWSFIWTQVVTYVKLKPFTDPVALEKKLETIAPRRIAPSFVKLGMDYQDFVREKGGWFFYLQPVKDIRLHSAGIWNRFEEVGDIAYLYIFAGIALFVLIIAAINFINLATARASSRAKEVGVKKSLGAFRRTLVFQFQFESILISVLATIVAVMLAYFLKPLIFEATGFELPIDVIGDSGMIITLIVFPLVLGFVAGLYPSFYLTAFQPVQVLKGKLVSGFKSGGLRTALVFVQFVIAIGMIAVTLVVQEQLRFMANKNLGLDKENLLVIRHADEVGVQLESFRNEVSNMDGVISVTTASEVPGRSGNQDIFGAEGIDTRLSIEVMKIDHQFMNTMGLKVIAGRSFREGSLADDISVILNENAVKSFGWNAEQAIGKRIIYPGANEHGFEVIGVVKDFHFASLHQNISPLIFFTLKGNIWGDSRVLAVKFKSEDVAAVRDRIAKRWAELAPKSPAEISFYSDEIERQYRNEKRLAGLFSIFTTFSIGVGVIGLIGLVSYSVDQRKKEIGVRKVFGASIPSLFVMMNSQYVKLMTVAIFVASPGAWYLLGKWLNSFAYHITLNPLTFVTAGLIEIALSLLCVSYLSIRAASLNPASVLKEE